MTIATPMSAASTKNGRKLARSPLLVLCVAAGLLLAGTGAALLATLPSVIRAPILYERDFTQDYLFGRALLSGRNPYTPTDELMHQFVPGVSVVSFGHPTPHLPTSEFVALPLALLTLPTASAVWVIMEIGFLFASLTLLFGPILDTPRVRIAAAVGATIALVSVPMVFGDLKEGQWTLLVLLLGVWGCREILAGHQITAGVLLGLSVLVKPILWPVLLLLLLRRFRKSVLAGGATTALGFGVTLVVLGPAVLESYFLEVLPAVSAAYAVHSRNQSVLTFGQRLFVGTGWAWFGQLAVPGVIARPLVDFPAIARPFSVLLVLLVLAGTLWLVRRRSLQRALAIMLAVSALLTPISWPYDAVLVLPLAIQLAWWIARYGRSRANIYPALGLATLLYIPNEIWERLTYFSAGLGFPPTQSRLEANYPLAVSFASGLWTLVPALSVALLIGLALILPDQRSE